MNPTAAFLMTLGQALAAQGLYSEGHPMRATARQRTMAALLRAIGDGGVLRISFLDGSVIVGSRILPELRGWEWGPRFAAAGVERLEIDARPEPTANDVDRLVTELQQRLQPGADHLLTVAHGGFRFGPFGIAADGDGGNEGGGGGGGGGGGSGGGGGGGRSAGTGSESERAVSDLFDALAQLPMTEEASAVRWIHDEIAAGSDVPMAEVEAVVHSLAMAMHRDQHVLLPLLDLKRFDQYTTTHSCNVAMLSIGLAEQLGLTGNDARAIGTAALSHLGSARRPIRPELNRPCLH